jgi:ribosomal protein S18 acetylase RimI-like enzyme
MTLTDARLLDDWTVTSATARDHSAIADFLATTDGLGGRKFAADSRDVAEQLDGVYPDGATVIRDRTGLVRGYSALHQPHGRDREEVSADFVFDPAAPPNVVDDVVGANVNRFARESESIPGAYLRVFVGANQPTVIEALVRRGAHREGEFIRTRKPLDGTDPAVLEATAIDGITVLSWSEVTARGLGEQVRRLQYDTFLEHFGNMSKTPETFHHHVHSRLFTPDFSVAAIDGTGEVVGYVLGSTYTAGPAGSDERSAHTDYIGVRRDRRKRGIAELLLGKIWLAALRRGLTAASLGTDINNRSNAHLLYERLGYVAVERQAAYRIDAGAVR